MPPGLFAVCRLEEGLQVKQVRLHPPVRQQVQEVFYEQAESFSRGVNEELAYDPGWTRDPNQLFRVGLTDEAAAVVDALAGGPLDIAPVNVANLGPENIKALMVCDDENDTIFVQGFTLAQRLDTKFALARDGNVFRRFDDSAFTIGTSLAFLICLDFIKFKSFQSLRSVFDMRETYRDLTREEVVAFVGHQSLSVDDPNRFVDSASEPIRKLIKSVLELGLLDQYPPEELQRVAGQMGQWIELRDGRILLPASFRELRDVLRLLNDDRLVSPLTGQTYITNSKQQVLEGE